MQKEYFAIFGKPVWKKRLLQIGVGIAIVSFVWVKFFKKSGDNFEATEQQE